MQPPIPGQTALDGTLAVELTDRDLSLIVTSLVALRAALDDAGVSVSVSNMPGEVTALANRLARVLS